MKFKKIDLVLVTMAVAGLVFPLAGQMVSGVFLAILIIGASFESGKK